MVQQIPLDLPGSRVVPFQERRSQRTVFLLPASLKSRLLAVAAACDVSENEVLISCLQQGLSDDLVLQLINRALSAKEREIDAEEEVRSNHLLPSSMKNRLREVAVEFGASPKRKMTLVAITCLQHGLRDAKLLREIQARAASRIKKLGRTAKYKEGGVHQAA
jgi:hypothetical protein